MVLVLTFSSLWVTSSTFHLLNISILSQVYKILEYIESYQKEHKLNSIPIILCGLVLKYHSCHSSANTTKIELIFCSDFLSDWNGSKRGHVYKFLRSQGFVSSYDAAHQYTDSDADAHKVLIFSLIMKLTNSIFIILWMLKTFFFPCSGLATAIITGTFVVSILYCLLILTSIENH